MLDQRRHFRRRERLAELSLNELLLRLRDDARLLRFGNSHERAQRRQIQLLFFRDDLQQETDRSDVGDFSDRFQHRFAQRLLRVKRQDRRQRGPIADLTERFDDVKLQPEIFALPEDAKEHRQRRCVAIFSERRHHRRRHVDVIFRFEHRKQQIESIASPQIAEKIDERQSNIDVGLVAQASHDRFDGRAADANQRFSR